MAYASAADMELAFQAKELAKLATPKKDNQGQQIVPECLTALIQGADTSSWTAAQIALAQEGLEAVNAALADAQREMDSYLVKQYSLPLSAETIALNPLVRKCADIARYLLNERRFKSDTQITARYNEALTWLRDVSSKRAALQLAATDSSATTFSSLRGSDKQQFTDMAGF